MLHRVASRAWGEASENCGSGADERIGAEEEAEEEEEAPTPKQLFLSLVLFLFLVLVLFLFLVLLRLCAISVRPNCATTASLIVFVARYKV